MQWHRVSDGDGFITWVEPDFSYRVTLSRCDHGTVLVFLGHQGETVYRFESWDEAYDLVQEEFRHKWSIRHRFAQEVIEIARDAGFVGQDYGYRVRSFGPDERKSGEGTKHASTIVRDEYAVIGVDVPLYVDLSERRKIMLAMHEAVHLQHQDHGLMFWKELESLARDRFEDDFVDERLRFQMRETTNGPPPRALGLGAGVEQADI